MQEDLVSVIVPVYNVEKYIHRCILSILEQSYKNLEIILVNDGSTDKSREVCEGFLEKDERVTVINKSNGGLSSARNCGLDVANGKYVCFVDGDDFIHPEMIRILHQEISSGKFDLVYCLYQKVYQNEIYSDIPSNYSVIEKSKTETFETLFAEELEIKLAWNKLYKKEIFETLRYAKGRLHEDEFIIHYILENVTKIKKVNLKLYYYFQRDNSIMAKLTVKRVRDTIAAYESRIKLIEENIELNKFKNDSISVLFSVCKRLYIQMMSDKKNNERKEIIEEIRGAYKKWFKQADKENLKISDKLFEISPLLFGIIYKKIVEKE